MKSKLCRVCKEEFAPFNSFQFACSAPCALEYAKKQWEAAQQRAEKRLHAAKRKRNREARVKLKTRQQWLREAQASFNAYIRERDKGNACISCGRHHRGQNHAGHYRTVAACPELRFNPLNCNLQCAPCNNHLSGNLVEYRKGLLDKVGPELLDWVEGPHNGQKLTIEDAKDIKQYYKEQLKLLKSGG